MSLLSKEDYATMTELPYNETFQNLFKNDNNKNITHADGKDLVLPGHRHLCQGLYHKLVKGHPHQGHPYLRQG